MKLKPCQFCGSEHVYLTENTVYLVACPNCGACGPWHDDSEEAVKEWNERVSDGD